MKKIIIAMAAIAAAFTMASCNKELVESEKNTTVGESVITASIENDLTKTSLEGNDTDGYKVFWSEGDNLLVGDYWEEDWYAEYTLENSSAGSSKGIFKWNKDTNFFHPIKRDDGTIYNEPIFETGKTYESIYPFSFFDFNEDGAAEGNTWKTEQTYADMYIPMYGKAECTEEGKADFMFKNLGGMLRLTVKGTATIRFITMHANEPISGEAGFIEDAEGNMFAEIVGGYPLMKNEIILDCGTNGVELNGDQGTDFYISIPCHYIYGENYQIIVNGYTGVTITLTDTEGKTCVKKLKNENGLVIERSKITTASFTASEFKANIPEGALLGKFSVSADKQVYFSQGNLKYTFASDSWGFFENQYDFDPGTNGASSTEIISLFTWGYSSSSTTRDHNYNVIGHEDGTNLNYEEDWGSLVGEKGTWRTLSMKEWSYLLNNGDYANNTRADLFRYGVTVMGKTNCLVLYPDGYAGTKVENGDTDTFSTEATYNAAMQEGIVILPAAGDRQVSQIHSVGVYGEYWSSTPYSTYNAFSLYFTPLGLSTGISDNRNYGFAVRLVTEVK